MIGAGTFINPLLKVLTTVAILAAAYFFILRPILDTTEETARSFGSQFGTAQEAQRQAEKLADQQGFEGFQVQTDSMKQARKILRCVQRAQGDTVAMAKCQP